MSEGVVRGATVRWETGGRTVEGTVRRIYWDGYASVESAGCIGNVRVDRLTVVSPAKAA